jgi:hypothetical protein
VFFSFIESKYVSLFSFLQAGSPPSRAYEAPTPGSGWANTPGGNYSEAGTPRDISSAYGTLLCHLNTGTCAEIFVFDLL